MKRNTFSLIKVSESRLDNSWLKFHLESFQNLIKSLESEQLKPETVAYINTEIERVNMEFKNEKRFKKQLVKAKSDLLIFLEKNENLVAKNHYRRLWMVVGLSAFGMPIGIIIGLLVGNIALLGVGLPLGMVAGTILGTRLDKKAAAENRQLDFTR
ncbi:hypothetical protein [Leeuwenhoekiella parthenopeia]|uniref:Glycine zipper family protein n=1 Tax=Leeuwenhoekiella parthenopeia TaxID=2890320 RepID=A0ABS8GSG0_9FLAO|nr:hypothetical protein [Leeuwenhoekiella parthenopeia]MCC4212929.1 hypothetical protein [Leeuwenhoekiella parthenopeia]